MILGPALPPQKVPILSGFDYVAVDALRRRVYAAHTGSDALLIVDADNGRVLGQVDVGGPLHGIAVDQRSGHVFTGDGLAATVSEIDPRSQTVLRSVDVDGHVDAIAYDPALQRIYADEDDGTRIFVIDARRMKRIAVIKIPGHKPEYLDIDPDNHRVYQNIADVSEIAVIDPYSLRVITTIRTPELTKNHPLQYDAKYRAIIAGGKNGVLASYTRSGSLISKARISSAVDQCNLNAAIQQIACAGGGEIDVLQIVSHAVLTPIASLHVRASAGAAHTIAYDTKTGRLWTVWAAPSGDVVQAFSITQKVH
jgi:DNA-binding beta-propeller fold protein YncE